MTEEDNKENLDDICEECKKEDQSVSQNLILPCFHMHGSWKDGCYFPMIF